VNDEFVRILYEVGTIQLCAWRDGENYISLLSGQLASRPRIKCWTSHI